MKKTPLQQVKDRYGDKAAAVSALKALVGDALVEDRFNEKRGIEHVSNAKLLKLLDTATEVKKRWGTRGGLIDAILKVERRKDPGYKTRLEKYPLPRLFDHFRAAERGAKNAKEPLAKAEGAKPPRPAKAKVTKAPAKAKSATKSASR